MSHASGVYRAECVFVRKRSTMFQPSRSTALGTGPALTEEGNNSGKGTREGFPNSNLIQKQMETRTDCTGWTMHDSEFTLECKSD